MPAGVVSVNFHPALSQLMLEARYLDRKGFKIPDVALQVALNESKYHQYTENLATMLESYYQVRVQMLDHTLTVEEQCELVATVNSATDHFFFCELGY